MMSNFDLGKVASALDEGGAFAGSEEGIEELIAFVDFILNHKEGA